MFNDPNAMMGRSDRSAIVRCSCGGTMGTLPAGERVASSGDARATTRILSCPSCGARRSVPVVAPSTTSAGA